ncbi:hypothetical protein M1116_03540 [Patescibacteria group bacterium]|nr:hypothetical protein [Patescibacteria group bacterium]
MASLTVTGYWARNIIKFGGVGLILLIVLQWGVSTAIAAYLKAHPPYVPPTVRYGKLPKIVFPSKDTPKVQLSLELPNDSFPKYSDQAKVYVVYKPVNTLTALDDGYVTAKSLGFTDQAIETKTGVYQWTNASNNLTFTMNVLDGSFLFKYPFEKDQLLQNPDHMPTNAEATNAAKTFLQRANKLSPDLDDGTYKFSYLKIGFSGLTAADSLSDADLVKVDIFRKATDDGMAIMPADPKTASVSFLISGSAVETKRIVQVNYSYSPIDRQSFSTYPIVTPQQAWADVQNGMYFLAQGDTTSTTVRKIYLAYFEPATLTNFMQPIYVFEGDNNFVAYLPAVADSMVSPE